MTDIEPRPSDVNFDDWKSSVDRLMKIRYCIDTDDAGLDDDQLSRYWTQMSYPFEFVDWYGSKYDLILASSY
ncbi:MAG: hypothetical protein H3C55_14380 [Pseudorhodoplanes sp.]|nr:hypothetical protein [Pseudorhodoplanes sp.]MBW7950520.1 hypothetical protein [Pseudorhodoplanes sp.]GIK79789.1 MAG: hypothetical protein BroJett024_08940 [Alphaproteobacteria bacterium]